MEQTPDSRVPASTNVDLPATDGPQENLRNEFTSIAIAFLAFLAGGLAMLGNMWPMSAVEETASYLLTPDQWGGNSTYEILMNDLDIVPYRHFAPIPFTKVSGRSYQEVEIPGMRNRRDAPLVYINHEKRPAVMTLIAGLTDTEESRYGVLLLDPEGRVQRQWNVKDANAAGHAELHGLAMLHDGSMIVSFNGGKTLTRYGACGEEIWRRQITAHHSVTSDGDGHVWTWDREAMVRVSTETGQIEKRIELEDLAERAPGKYILTSRKFFDMNTGSRFEFDPFHPNDVEALPAAFADSFPMFKAGDLLVSLRSGNLIMVVDPDTREIVWWMREGSFGQHDPDWLPDGRILLFDNNTDFGESRILSIDPATKTYDVVLSGQETDFYTDLMGNQEMHEDGNLMVSLSRQGRAIEYDRYGDVLFEYLNRYNGAQNQFGLVTEARTLPMDFVDRLPPCTDTVLAGEIR